jgi:hypothetical protein
MPVAPGYKVQKETLSVHLVSGAPPHLAIRAQYELANVGNVPLDFIGVTLPGEKEFGRANLRAEINNEEIAPQHNPHEAADDWRIYPSVSWREKGKLNLVLSYDLASQSVTDPRIFVAANTFYLNDSGWFPTLRGFKAFLSPAVVRPNQTAFTVIVPAYFRVTASGQPSGAKKHTGETEYHFRIGKSDFSPYVLAGQYQQQIVSAAGVTVAIWTFKPIPAEQAEKTAAQIATAANFYAKNFGPLPSSMKAIYGVQPSRSVSDENFTWGLWQGLSLPGIVYDATLDLNDSLRGASVIAGFSGLLELPNTWFEHIIIARPGAAELADGLASYAFCALDSCASKSRTETVSSALSDYDQDGVNAVEKPIISLTAADSREQFHTGADKMQLFFFALEDKCGPENVRHAVADMVYALRGGEYGYPEFRSALERQCHQDLAGFFHTWLAQQGIPPDFRARYQSAGGGKQ